MTIFRCDRNDELMNSVVIAYFSTPGNINLLVILL